jgi:fluoride exporter
MLKILAIALGGAVGALARYWLTGTVNALIGHNFPYGTLFVNVLGSLTLGLCFVWFVERAGVPSEIRFGVMVGLLGALTTFSTFSLETFVLLDGGRLGAGLLNVATSVVLCVAGCWLGILAARALS